MAIACLSLSKLLPLDAGNFYTWRKNLHASRINDLPPMIGMQSEIAAKPDPIRHIRRIRHELCFSGLLHPWRLATSLPGAVIDDWYFLKFFPEKNMKKIALTIAGLMLCGIAATAQAEDDKAYKDGPVTIMTYVKVKPGKFDEYMKWLDSTAKPLREAEVKAGILVGYHVYLCQPHSPHDPDLILADTYPNMAALDKSDEQDALAAKQLGARPAQNKAAEDRESLREILGSDMVREQILK